MADTLEFSLVARPFERFDAALVEELKRECASLIEFDGEDLVIGHVYTERRMERFTWHVEDCRRSGDDGALRLALREYGQAIKELAGAGIFPGDMLLKTFGVTRHDRVVFYDYDEIQPMTEMSFRRIPPAKTYEEELAAEPYWRGGGGQGVPRPVDPFLGLEPPPPRDLPRV